AVDAEVAAQMAEGVRERLSKAAGKDLGSVIGIATTGVAGPRSVSGRYELSLSQISLVKL
ncbi:MAG: CinA family protein, partial [Porticoccus sp.]